MKKTAQALRWALAGLAFGLSPLYFVRVANLSVFKVQLGLTEFGHWLVLPTLLLALWPRPKGARFIAKLACFAAALLFASPALRAWRMAPSMERTTSVAWYKAELQAERIFSWERLFVPPRPSEGVATKTLTYDAIHDLRLTVWSFSMLFGDRLRLPYVIVVHGGGWDGGHRDDFPDWDRATASLGYVVLDVDYRLAPASPWPAQRDDLLNVMRYAQANALALHLDPTRCVLFGRSAGAHLALATAYLAEDPRIKGVISFYGPADLFFAYKYGKPDDILKSLDLLKNLCSGTPETAKATYEECSPYFHVGAKTPPTLLAHGDIDALVWNKQSIRLSEQLKAAGRPYQFIELPWATHAFDYNFTGPSGQLTWYAVRRFLSSNFSR